MLGILLSFVTNLYRDICISGLLDKCALHWTINIKDNKGIKSGLQNWSALENIYLRN
jgi:hypothetical protein